MNKSTRDNEQMPPAGGNVLAMRAVAPRPGDEVPTVSWTGTNTVAWEIVGEQRARAGDLDRTLRLRAGPCIAPMRESLRRRFRRLDPCFALAPLRVQIRSSRTVLASSP